jgi:hypothetical protein
MGIYGVFVSIPRPIVLKLATKRISTVGRCGLTVSKPELKARLVSSAIRVLA